MDGKCGVCGDPYDSDRPNEAGGRYANGIIARTYDSADEFIEVTIEVTASVGGYFEFRLCPHNNIYKPVKQSCLDQYPLRIEGNGRRLYPDLPLGKSGFVIAKLSIPQGVTCKQCVLQWKWHGGNHWGMCTNGIGLAGCGPQTEFYNCADISILPKASSRDIKHDIKPSPKQNSSTSLTNRKAPTVMTFITKTTTASSATSTGRKVRSETTTPVPSTTTQSTPLTVIGTTQEYISRKYLTPNRTTLEYKSRHWFTPTITTNSLAVDYNTIPQTIPITSLPSTLDSIEYHTTMMPRAETTISFFSDSLRSNIITSSQDIGQMMDNGVRYMSDLPASAHNLTSATEGNTPKPDAEISTATMRSTGISTTPTPMTGTADKSIRTSPNITTTTVTTTKQTDTTTKTTTMSSTSTSAPIFTVMPTVTTSDRSTTALYTITTTAATTTQPSTMPNSMPLTISRSTQTPSTEPESTSQSISTTPTPPTTTEPESTSQSISTTPIPTTTTEPESTSQSISTTPTPTPTTEPESTSQSISTTPTPSTTTPTRILTRTIYLITAPTGSHTTSQTMTSSTLNPAELINTVAETPTTTTTEASTTTAKIPQTTTIFQTTKAKEATLPTTIKSATKVIDQPRVRGSAPARRKGGLSVATLFPFDLTRNLIDPSNSGINTEIKPVRRAGSNSLFSTLKQLK
ncbi:hypothetical protein ACJMK2_024539 [Sinanodonta woodiana]|uniref:Chitin-binding type-4 domain-containing protein n=1 Tax=Sinanodonta woodiana TaxID=1069815 RepID=A0ABD3XF79_SINWO